MGTKALEALLTLAGQNTYNLDALLDLLVQKGMIAESELDEAMEKVYLDRKVVPAEWARRCLNPEDNEALDAFFSGRSRAS